MPQPHGKAVGEAKKDGLSKAGVLIGEGVEFLSRDDVKLGIGFGDGVG